MKKGSKRRIVRLTNDCLIAGVCSGLADYFEVDATLIRIIFVLLSLGGGSGIIIYLLLWLIIPKKGEENMKINREKKVEDFAEDLGKKAGDMAKEIRKEVKGEKRKGNFLGLILIIVGFSVLAEKFFPMTVNWDYVWPGTLVFLGLYLVFRR